MMETGEFLSIVKSSYEQNMDIKFKKNNGTAFKRIGIN